MINETLDPLFVKATELLKGKKFVTVGYIQRGLGIYYGRARLLVEALQSEGLLGNYYNTNLGFLVNPSDLVKCRECNNLEQPFDLCNGICCECLQTSD